MIITVASFKGGVGKTTTAVHLAAYLNRKGAALLVDGDQNRSAMTWAAPGKLPFKVVTDIQMPKYIRQFEHIIIDTQARPTKEDLEELADSCDLLILPTTPKALDLDALLRTIEILHQMKSNFKVLLTMVPPPPSQSGKEAKEMLLAENIPIFKAEIKRLVAFERAPLEGVIVKDYPDPRADAAWAGYEELGKEIMV
ncbi:MULTISPECIES: ParA family protein [Nostoc]|uniref:Chromosome partitioning protein ParA n=2 Tax=Nostoc TaxID=1177 RepID=A0A367R1X3_NOSPU|nr:MULTISPECIES: ParA family protein [unclassified Nostoc]MBD2533832.1 ParA family protein [Nostoc flagelliforme FACHB-838]MBG1269755.1 ParA family protein [Nostoc sp. WHI]MCC5654694.1 ParA family protein [Nostoc sp. XA013]RCJ30476.1 chromosome partitioning protein ParA [Nostoc punctiforme NIES-2108]MBN3957322.1 ParA family protein [Nostoc sp. NMS8]